MNKPLPKEERMKLFIKKPRVTGVDDTFVRLIQIATENKEIREQILAILSLDAFNRKSALNTFIQNMRLKGAPGEFISAIATFLDDAVAEKALSILKRGKGIG
jgi:hypothetical protein